VPVPVVLLSWMMAATVWGVLSVMVSRMVTWLVSCL
jgi:hypothetical protein